jgi:hypothetical protein
MSPKDIYEKLIILNLFIGWISRFRPRTKLIIPGNSTKKTQKEAKFQ